MKKLKLMWQQIPSPLISELLCSSKNFDGVVLDLEHGVFSNESLFNCIQIIKLSGKLCLTRLADFDKTLLRYSLDSGADGIIFATVEDYNYAKKIFEECTYPKFGGKRGVGLVRENFWGEKELQSKIPLVIAQIETKKGVDNIEEIAKIGFDYFFIGPYDLSTSLGDGGNFESQEFKSSIQKIQDVVGKEKTGYHIVKDVENQLPKLKDIGLLALSTDT